MPGKVGLAAFDFPEGTLLLTEAGSQRQASLHAVRGAAALAAHDPGGADVFALTLDEFDRQLRRENHTLKRALTDPHSSPASETPIRTRSSWRLGCRRCS